MKKSIIHTLVLLCTLMSVNQTVSEEGEPIPLSEKQSGYILVDKPTGLEAVFALSGAQSTSDEDTIRLRIDQGQKVLQNIFNGTPIANTPENIQAVIWALFAEAAKKDQVFTEGMFVVEDPDKKLFTFLINQDNAYKRTSTHFKGLKEANQEYGIDVPSDSDQFALPVGKRTILTGYLPDRGAVYIKPENYGLKSYYDFFMHAGETVGSVARKTAPAWFGSNEQEGYRKEHIPEEVKKSWEKVVTELRSFDFITNIEAQQALSLGNKYGICAMYDLLNNWKQREGVQVPIEAKETLREVGTLFEKYDNKAIRQGNEVIFTLAELQRDLGFNVDVVPLESKKITFSLESPPSTTQEGWGAWAATKVGAATGALTDIARSAAYEWMYAQQENEVTELREQINEAIQLGNLEKLNALRSALFRHLQRTVENFGTMYEETLKRGLDKYNIDPKTGVYALLGLNPEKDATVENVTQAIQRVFQQGSDEDKMKLRQLTFIFGMEKDDAPVDPFSLRLYNAYRNQGIAGVNAFRLTGRKAEDLLNLQEVFDEGKLNLEMQEDEKRRALKSKPAITPEEVGSSSQKIESMKDLIQKAYKYRHETRDYEQARKYYEEAIARRNENPSLAAFATAELGEMYFLGRGVPIDYQKAKEYLNTFINDPNAVNYGGTVSMAQKRLKLIATQKEKASDKKTAKSVRFSEDLTEVKQIDPIGKQKSTAQWKQKQEQRKRAWRELKNKIYGDKIDDSLRTAPELEFGYYGEGGLTDLEKLSAARTNIEQFLSEQIERMRKNNMKIGLAIFNNNSTQDLLEQQNELNNQAINQFEQYQNNEIIREYPPTMITPYIKHLIKHIQNQIYLTTNMGKLVNKLKRN